MDDLQRIVKALCEAEVRFVVIGGAAAAAQGSAYPTYDLDICYERDRDNFERLARSLGPFHPRLKGVEEDLPFCFDAATLAHGMNFTLTTDIGEVDLLGELGGIGGYEDARALSITLDLFGFPCAVLSLDGLIRCKRATARPKDLLMLPELEALREIETRRQTKP